MTEDEMSTHCGICFGQGHSEEQCGSQPKPRVTQAYSFIDPQRIVNVGERTVEPTIPMEAVELLSVKDIVHRLIERNLQAWRALPEKIRNRMIDRPQDFQLVLNKQRKEGDFDTNIVYSGTVWRYHGTALTWVIDDII